MNDNKTASRWTIDYAIEYEKTQVEKIEEASKQWPDIYQPNFKAVKELHYFIIDCLKELKEIRENRS